MSLKTRFQLLIAAVLLITSAATWAVFERIAEGIVEEWGLRIAEIQVRYDSARLLQPLEREIALAMQMADSTVLRRWSRNPRDADLLAAAKDEMESFRRNFRDQNYFVALRESGAYYHNNAANEFVDEPYRYSLDPDDPDDAWFFLLIEQGKQFHININPDVELGVTKLWIDVLMHDDNEITGMVGTGLELDSFLEEIVDIGQPGITTLFVDHSGAIQLHRDPDVIDYASLVKPEGQKNSIDLLLDGGEVRMRQMMEQLRAEHAGPEQVLTDFVSMDGKRHLAGIAYLPAIDWFEVTLIDLDELMPVSHFASVALVFSLMLLGALLIMHIALRRLLLNPLLALEQAMLKVQAGNFEAADELPSSEGEIGRVISHFRTMARAIRDNTRHLEAKVHERTMALDRLARHDDLTGLFNRRGMNELLHEVQARCLRDNQTYGLIWLDLDNFKDINDNHGHGKGDLALQTVATQLRAGIRPYDHAARWGGDEFLVLLNPCDRSTLSLTAERLREMIADASDQDGPAFTVSVGAYLAAADTSLHDVLQAADDALYQAKEAGRNQCSIVTP
ncbi:GGDEF domain-containing protein [Halopseudomonas salegens]|uniref:GGDEF domain-containing protein n=1 Tax=Halopseudomonas salegens TaxID=1434072 RepID=UPI000ACD4CB2|nr:diguanylate cyclase [Halopseudomonas salegens]